MPREYEPYDRAANEVLSQNTRAATAAANQAKDWDKVGTAIENTRGGLARLAAQVKATEQIFQEAARRGDATAGRAVMDFFRQSDHLTQSFTRTYATFGAGFRQVSSHADEATSHLKGYMADMLSFHNAELRHGIERKRVLSDQIALEAEIAADAKKNKGQQSEELLIKRGILEKSLAINEAQAASARIMASAAPMVVAWGATVERVLVQSHKYQREFRDISMDFTSSMQTTQNLLNTVVAGKGLYGLEQAAESMKSLRVYGQDFAKDPHLITTMTQLSSVTGMSTESLAAINYQLTTLTGQKPDFDQLANSFAFFARSTDLTASGIQELLTQAQPLITSYPRELKTGMITQVMAMGDAFKHAGLQAGEMLNTLNEMRDLTSSGGMKSAALVSAASGMSLGELTQGTNILKQSQATTKAIWTYMQQFSGLGLNTAASIVHKQFGLGSQEQNMRIGQMSPRQLQAMEEREAYDMKQAANTKNLREELDKIMSGPMGKVEVFFRTLNNLSLQAGLTITGGIMAAMKALSSTPVNWVFKAIDKLFKSFTENGAVFQGAVQTVVTIIAIQTPKAIYSVGRAFLQTIHATNILVGAFQRMIGTMEQAAIVANMGGGRPVGGAMGEVFSGGEKGAVSLAEKEAAALAVRGGGQMAARAGGGMMARAGGFAGKVFGAKMGAGKLLSHIPIAGVGIGALVGGAAAYGRYQDPNQRNAAGFGQMALEIGSGVASGMGPLGWGFSLLADSINAMVDMNREKDKDKGKDGKPPVPGLEGDWYHAGAYSAKDPSRMGGGKEGVSSSGPGKSSGGSYEDANYVPAAGAPTPFTGKATRADISSKYGYATLRYNNPSGMKEGASSRKFGASTYGLDETSLHEQVMRFPSKEAGAAAQFDLLRKYFRSGKTVHQAVDEWSNHGDGSPANVAMYTASICKATGLHPGDHVSDDFLSGPGGIEFVRCKLRKKEEGYIR